MQSKKADFILPQQFKIVTTNNVFSCFLSMQQMDMMDVLALAICSRALMGTFVNRLLYKIPILPALILYPNRLNNSIVQIGHAYKI